MSRFDVSTRKCGLRWRSECIVLFALFLFIATVGVVAQVPSRNSADDHGAFEITSGLGRKLYALPDDQSVIDARKSLAADPNNVELVLRLSKAQASRRQYREAVATATQGLVLAPNDADFYLERGHRKLGLREFEQAMNDLGQAVRIAPQMLDAHYHLGLAHYFSGDFGAAVASFERARSLAKSNDSLIDCSNWLYVSLRRAGNEQEAAQVLTRITPDVSNTEPHLYFYLRLLHFYQGQITEDAVLPPPPAGPEDLEGELAFDTVSYGVGNWLLYHQKRSEAVALFSKVVKGEAWNAWGFIGSEMELVHEKK
jgi:tetratricopeptide (TPR) repeat protein